MLPQEAEWFQTQLHSLADDQLKTVVNIGSQTRQFRERQQPYLLSKVLNPITDRGGKILHIDIQRGEGIDLVGDISDISFRDQISKMIPSVVLCSNLLEHTIEPYQMASACSALLPAGGILLISCPKDFPYHPDPIDNRLRPTVTSLLEMFTGCRLLAGAEVPCGTMADYLKRQNAGWLKALMRVCLPRRGIKIWKRDIQFLLWAALNRRITATAVVLEKC